MAPDPFAHPIDVSEDRLRVERFVETRNVESFDCGDKDLNDFLCTEEVARYDRENLGRTYLAYYEGDLAGYFTVSNDGLRVEYLKQVKSFSKLARMKLETIPALKIGRLAVDRRYQSRGVGRLLLRYIAGMAIEIGRGTGIRLLILQAKPQSVSFYLKAGFQLTYEVKRERGRRNRTMFLDLFRIAGD